MKLIYAILLICLSCAFVYAQGKPLTLYLAGDSTMAQKQPDKRPETGWGEMLQQFFDRRKIVVDNRALNGRSTKSFITEGHWQKIVDNLKPGDYVFIEFGHNDEKKDKPTIYAEADTDYRANLMRFVMDARTKKAFPVLLTSIARRKFDDAGKLIATHGAYPAAVKRVAQELNVPLIDMEAATSALLQSYGAENSRRLFLQLKPNENPNYPNGVEDNTHLSPLGAEELARLAVEIIRRDKLKLAKLLLSPAKVKKLRESSR